MPRTALLIALFAALACQDPVSPAPAVATSSPLMARSAPEMFNERVPFSFIAAVKWSVCPERSIRSRRFGTPRRSFARWFTRT